MKTSEILKAAKERIGTPDKWHKGQWAKGASLNDLRDGSDAPCCAEGALHWVKSDPRRQREAIDILNRLATAKGFGGTLNFNDHSAITHADIMALFDSAIAEAEARE